MSRDANWSSFRDVSLRDTTEAVEKGRSLGKLDGTIDENEAWDSKSFREAAPRKEHTPHPMS